jgi:proline iminopeptidase
LQYFNKADNEKVVFIYLQSLINLFMKKTILFFFFCFFFAIGFAQNYPSSYTDGKYVTVNGAKLYVVLVGSGDPLIIIPGGPGGAHPGYRVFDSLAKDNEIIYYDAFGRGKSDTRKM